MDQQKLSNSERPAGPAPHGQTGSKRDLTPSSTAMQSTTAVDRLALLQQAFLLDQLTMGGSKPVGELNKKIPVVAQRELQLSIDVANKVRRELAEKRYL